MTYHCNLTTVFRLVWERLGIIALLILCLQTPGTAQVTTAITSDGTMGTIVHQDHTMHRIDGGTPLGPNLFHSFDQFRLGTGDTASFAGPQSGIDNIISRVTGGEQSIIDGTLHTAIPDANLFLLNPSGVLFGANARLDVSGSFHVSTAHALHFSDGTVLDTDPNPVPMFTVAAPVAFGFMTPHPKPIEIEGSELEVPEGETLSVIGGNIRITGGVVGAAQGTIRLVGTKAAEDVILASPAPGVNVNETAIAPMYMGAIEIVGDARINVSGNGAGRIVIEGGEVLFDDATILVERMGAGAAGHIHIRLHDLRI